MKEHPFSNNFDPDILQERLLEINPDYNISFIDGIIDGEIMINDILVAKPN